MLKLSGQCSCYPYHFIVYRKARLKFGTRKIMITGFLLAGITATVCFLLPDSIYVMFPWLFVGIPLMLLPNLLIWANVSDSIDYNSYLSGQRQEGVIYSSYSFARKMGQALAGFIAGTGLSFIGYQAELETQPASVLLGIDALMFLLPAVALFISSWPNGIVYFWLNGQLLCKAQRREHSRSYVTGVATPQSDCPLSQKYMISFG
ncbi:MFS transporter [Endozoicomonas acroporae]|uniref:MFS transporter n=1 Tax=Endozoicomonas acroporae TaxID=1701104 RepID=UPI003D78F051